MKIINGGLPWPSHGNLNELRTKEAITAGLLLGRAVEGRTAAVC